MGGGGACGLWLVVWRQVARLEEAPVSIYVSGVYRMSVR